MRITLVGLIWLLGFSVSAQRLTDPKVINITTKDYNGQAQNFAIKQDARGIIYVANVGGLMEFDGSKWRTMSPEENSLVVSLDIDANNQVYIGGLGEIGRMTPNDSGLLKFESLNTLLPDSLHGYGMVWQTFALNERVYFNAGANLFVLNDDHIQSYPTPTDDIDMFVVGDEIWVNSPEKGLFRFAKDRFEHTVKGDFFAGKRVVGIQPLFQDKYVVVTRDGPMYVYAEDIDHQIVPFASELSGILQQSIPFKCITLHDGNLAINTIQNGIFILDKQQRLIRHLTRNNGLQNESVIGLFEDENQLLWCALDNGISIVDLSGNLTYAYEGKAFFGAVQDILESERKLYLATMQGLFYANLSDSNQVFRKIEGVPGLCVDLHKVGREVLVCAKELYSVDGDEVRQIADLRARTLTQLSDKPDLVIGGGVDGIFILEHDSTGWATRMHYPDFPHEPYYIRQIGRTPSFWVRTLQGIYRLNFSKDYTTVTHEAVQSEAFSDGIISMVTYAGNTLFSQKDRLLEYNSSSEEFVSTSLLKGMHNTYMHRLQAEGDHVWISTGRKLFHYNAKDLDTSSFQGVDIGGIHSLLPDGNGNCWIGGDDALMLYEHKRPRPQNFSCNLRQISLGDSVIFLGAFFKDGALSLSQVHVPDFEYENNSISFEYAASWYLDDGVQYSHFLEGYDAGFSSWTSDAKAVYTSLPEGEYTFKVKARNIYGEETEVQSYSFVIHPPWYRTWWAYTLFIVAGVLVMWLIVQWYVRRLRKEKERLEDIVAARTAELDLKNQDLEQINEEITVQKALVEEKNKDITDSIRYAVKIQTALLTSRNYMRDCFRDHFLLYEPKDILSGDFYWAYDTEEVLVWMVADCTGHGVPGSLMSMLGNSFINEIVIEKGLRDPGKILDELRDHVINALSHNESSRTRDGMDLALCVWHKSDNKLVFSGAKNPVWIVRTQGEPANNYDRKHTGESSVLYEWRGNNQPVGFVEAPKPFGTVEVNLYPDDVIVMFSDGYADQFGGAAGKKIQQKQFKEWMLSVAKLSGEEIEKDLLDRFNTWKGDHDQIDDVCVLGVRVV